MPDCLSVLRIPVLLCFLLSVAAMAGQALPPIENYQPREYQGENQNWGITQDSRGRMYFANNGGLLEFNGTTWKRHPSPNGSVLRSVLAQDQRIYSGCYMEFGYWARDTFGELEYTSLSAHLDEELLEDEQFWKIRALDDWVLFQSLQRIYAYRVSDGNFEIIPSEASRAQLFTIQGDIYYLGRGTLYRLENGRPTPLASTDPSNTAIVGVATFGEHVNFITEEGRFLRFEGNRLVALDRFAPALNPPLGIYTSIQLGDGDIAMGTISQGVIILDTTGVITQHISKENGLNNNTVLALQEDRDGNLWLGLDNGISVINRSAAFQEFNDPAGRLGVVYAAAVYQAQLYLGTNQGLFRRPLDASGAFEIIPGTEGQVWSLREISGTLFCGHNQGTFVVRANGAELISDRPGTWDIRPVPGEDSLLLQGNYQGLSVLSLRSDGWRLRNSLTGFDISSRFFEFTPEGHLVVNHEYKGVFTLKPDPGLTRVSVLTQRPPWGVGASLFKYGGDLCYATGDAFYRYSRDQAEFTLDSLTTSALMGDSDRPMGVLIPDPSTGRLWGFGNGAIHYLDPGPLDTDPIHKKVPVPADFRLNMGVLGFECLAPLQKDRYLIGRSNGFVILDLNNIRKKNPEVRITAVQKEGHNQQGRALSLDSIPEIPYGRGSIAIEYNVPEYGKFDEVEYQYRLALQYHDPLILRLIIPTRRGGPLPLRYDPLDL